MKGQTEEDPKKKKKEREGRMKTHQGRNMTRKDKCEKGNKEG